jgi:hypothetical protein
MESNAMADPVVTICLSWSQATFLQANLSRQAATTRQAMTQPGLETDRHRALGSRAIVLEIVDDALRSAMLEGSSSTRKSARGVEAVARPQAQQPVPDCARPADIDPQIVARVGPARLAARHRSQLPPPADLAILALAPAPAPSAPAAGCAREDRIKRCPSNAWLHAILGERYVVG